MEFAVYSISSLINTRLKLPQKSSTRFYGRLLFAEHEGMTDADSFIQG